MKNNIIGKILLIMLILFIVLASKSYVFADAAFFYPGEYNITINNINKNDVKKIELIYATQYGFNYVSDEDKERIANLTTKEIDDVAMSYVHKDASGINGYWIDREEIKTNTLITKFAIFENIDIKYNNNKALIKYSSKGEPDFSINSMYLRIEKSDGTIIYSNIISSKKVGIADEFSTDEEVKKSKSVMNEKAYFETDFSVADNYLEVVEVENLSDVNDVNIADDTNFEEPEFKMSNYIVFAIIIVVLIISIIVIIKLKKKEAK